MARLVFTVTGLNAVTARIERLAAKSPKVAGAALNQQGEEVIALAKEYVPVDLGTLRSSAFVRPPETVRVGARATVAVEAGFGGPAAPYAVAVHENPRAGRTGGVSPAGRRYTHWARTGGWKYLERAVKEILLPPSAVAIYRDGLVTRAGLRKMKDT